MKIARRLWPRQENREIDPGEPAMEIFFLNFPDARVDLSPRSGVDQQHRHRQQDDSEPKRGQGSKKFLNHESRLLAKLNGREELLKRRLLPLDRGGSSLEAEEPGSLLLLQNCQRHKHAPLGSFKIE